MLVKLNLDSEIAKIILKQLSDNNAKLVLFNSFFCLDKYYTLVGNPDIVQERLKITKYEFELGIRILKKLGVVRKRSKTEYMFNPSLFSIDNSLIDIINNIWSNQTTPGRRL